MLVSERASDGALGEGRAPCARVQLFSVFGRGTSGGVARRWRVGDPPDSGARQGDAQHSAAQSGGGGARAAPPPAQGAAQGAAQRSEQRVGYLRWGPQDATAPLPSGERSDRQDPKPSQVRSSQVKSRSSPPAPSTPLCTAVGAHCSPPPPKRPAQSPCSPVLPSALHCSRVRRHTEDPLAPPATAASSPLRLRCGPQLGLHHRRPVLHRGVRPRQPTANLEAVRGARAALTSKKETAPLHRSPSIRPAQGPPQRTQFSNGHRGLASVSPGFLSRILLFSQPTLSSSPFAFPLPD